MAPGGAEQVEAALAVGRAESYSIRGLVPAAACVATTTVGPKSPFYHPSNFRSPEELFSCAALLTHARCNPMPPSKLTDNSDRNLHSRSGKGRCWYACCMLCGLACGTVSGGWVELRLYAFVSSGPAPYGSGGDFGAIAQHTNAMLTGASIGAACGLLAGIVIFHCLYE